LSADNFFTPRLTQVISGDRQICDLGSPNHVFCDHPLW
jgi:hypothetical protein